MLRHRIAALATLYLYESLRVSTSLYERISWQDRRFAGQQAWMRIMVGLRVASELAGVQQRFQPDVGEAAIAEAGGPTALLPSAPNTITLEDASFNAPYPPIHYAPSGIAVCKIILICMSLRFVNLTGPSSRCQIMWKDRTQMRALCGMFLGDQMLPGLQAEDQQKREIISISLSLIQ